MTSSPWSRNSTRTPWRPMSHCARSWTTLWAVCRRTWPRCRPRQLRRSASLTRCCNRTRDCRARSANWSLSSASSTRRRPACGSLNGVTRSWRSRCTSLRTRGVSWRTRFSAADART
ncbi:hypothetical protein DPMN_179593 [Dreissena polymorpha]|uniref:Uncharacterized protein n=1 Tax=Dreissena polymorpha TaxID=45954 RepID=A0A9D4EHD1_DREPO|nr:hypothetical protein DPMN_179593 [Dreissena polymorpha]